MPIVLEKASNIERQCTPQEKEMYINLIVWFRNFVADDMPERNILQQQRQTYTDEKILEFFDMACKDINVALPITNFSITQICDRHSEMLLVRGAVIFALIREGLINVKNMVNYNDYGLNVNFFDKAPHYQSWIGMLMNDYLTAKMQFKQSITVNMPNAGFFGIASEFAYMDMLNGNY